MLFRTEVGGLHGDHILRAISLRNNETGEEWMAQTSWLSLCLGGVPRAPWAAEVGMIRDEGGYLVTGPILLKDGKRPQFQECLRRMCAAVP